MKASSRTACSAQRCMRVAERTRASSRSIQSRRSSAPMAKKTRATSSIERSVASATATMSGAWTSSARRAWAVATSSGTPSPVRRLTVSSRRRAALLGAELREHGGEALEAVAAGGDRLLERRAGRAREVPAGRRLDQRVDAAEQLELLAAADVLEPLDRLPQRVGAGHLDRDPEGAHHGGDVDAALGDHLRDERRAESVDGGVRVEHADQLRAQRVLGQQVPAAAPRPRAGSRSAGRAPATGRRRTRWPPSERATQILA